MIENASFPEWFYGYWWITLGFPDPPGLLVLTPGHRAIQFSTVVRPQKDGQIMRLWFESEGPEVIRFRPSPTAGGWLRTFEGGPEDWTMIAGESRFGCTRADPTEIPGWVFPLVAELGE